MKNRLQKLWKWTVPRGMACPQPEADEVIRRVRAALGGKPRARTRGAAKHAVLLAAALLLLTAIALAAGSGRLSEGSVLDTVFGRGENPALAESLVNAVPVSVSDENYTMTVTSSVADSHNIYFTLEIRPKTDAARAFLEAGRSSSGSDSFRFRIGIWGDTSGGGGYSPYDPETETLKVSVKRQLLPILSGTVKVRFEPMEEGLWLKFPVRRIGSTRLRIEADAPGRGSFDHAAGGPVRLHKLELSPLSLWMKYDTPELEAGEPVLFFLWKDGHISTMGELDILGPSGNATSKDGVLQCRYTWRFRNIQDLTKMEAVLYGNTAYPLDGGEPYPFDAGGLPQPFHIPLLEPLPEVDIALVPLSALCDGLQIPYQWEEQTQTASMTFRGVTVSVQAGSRALQIQGGSVPSEEMEAAAVLIDGELWACLSSFLARHWQIQTEIARENSWAEFHETDEISEEPRLWWVVTP